MNSIVYVTRNPFKFSTAAKILGNYGIEVVQKTFDVPEIQTDSSQTCACFSAEYASLKLGIPCLKNDSGLFIDALNGFPGVYTDFVERTLSEQDILRIMEGKTNREASLVEVFAFARPGKATECFTSVTKGKIAESLSGDFGYGYDHYFIPEGSSVPLAHYPDEKRFSFWNDKGYHELAKYLLKCE